MSWAKRTNSSKYDHWYKTPKWRRLRRAQLEAEPLCRMCLEIGKHTEAIVADHITPHKGDKKLFADKGNLQSLCRYCHNSHKFREERYDKIIGHDALGRPLDKGSHWYK